MISVENVTKVFQESKKKGGSVTALHDISFQIREGEVIGLLGENGAGKTTLMRIIATLLEPTQGRVTVNGRDVRHDAMAVKKSIGVLFGGETGLYERLTARENLEYFASLYGMSKHETKVRIDALAAQFGMKDYLDRRVGGFSKGMRQKVAISRALLHDPQTILFDEPTTGLDITSANVFRQLVHRLKKEGKTILFSSHIMEEVQLLCEQVVMIHKGKMVYNGSLEELYAEENSQDLNYIFMSRLVRG